MMPIDSQKCPTKDKYILQNPECRYWFLFGIQGGEMDIITSSDGEQDIAYLPLHKARKVVAARDAFVEVLINETNR